MMDAWKDGKTKRKYQICFLLLWVAQMAAAFWFCAQKQGFHEDELYTYYSTARTNGFYVEDEKWMDRETLRNEFVVLPGEGFRYGLVREVQSWDVHPPMYYWVFHTVASLVPDVFSKWIGLSVNLFFHGINLLLIAILTNLVSKKNEAMTLLVTFVYGFSPAALSGVVFIRMYEMLTMFVLLCAILHLRVVQAETRGRSDVLRGTTLLTMAAVTYLGFLTQYYYFIFLFFLAAAFCLWLLWKDRKIGNCLRYALAQGLAFGLAYLTYPAFPGQMFRGQRGAQAVDNFFDLGNTFQRIWFFLDLMNGYVFGYLFFIVLLAMAFLAAATHRRRQGASLGIPRFGWLAEEVPYFLLLFATVGYFLTVSKTALLLGETSNRYQLPIYGIVVLLLFLGVRMLWRRQFAPRGLAGTVDGGKAQENEKNKILVFLGKLVPAAVKVVSFLFWLIGSFCLDLVELAAKHRKGTERIAIAFALMMTVSAHWRTDVIFLYPEAAERTAFAKEQAADAAAVYFYRPGDEWCIWASADELMAYPQVYFAAADSAEPIADVTIENAEALTVYLAEGADAETQIGRLPWENESPVEDEWQLVFEEKYCDVYRWRSRNR
ncbi:MAG: hypothetical protein NC302_07200 [Bacteroidales bacterium]|nr:hypothetical protein [Bacteroidales bacterium]MCM1415520.1 hypothetical protein [bacterium]MCM1423720.1 hypothetical protein [bacterium]